MHESFLQLKKARAFKRSNGFSVSMLYEYVLQNGKKGCAFVDRFVSDSDIKIENETIFVDVEAIQEIEESIGKQMHYKTVGILIVETNGKDGS